MRYRDNRWGAWLGMAALVAVLGIVIGASAAVGGHGASSSGSAPPDAARAQTTALSARTPVPPMTGQGATANPPEVTPTPAVTPVESVSGAASDLATAQPAVTTTQALEGEAHEDVQQSPKLPEAGSSPATLASTNESQVRAAVEALFPPSEVETAMRVSWCESRYDPTAVEPSGDHEGVWQVDASLHGAVPSDIYSQTVQAYGIWQQGGWSAWSCR